MTAPIRPAATFQRAPDTYDVRDQNELRRSIAQIIDTVTVATGISGLTASILALPTIASVTADDTLIVNDGATTPSLATAAVLRAYILQISGGTATIAEHLTVGGTLTKTGTGTVTLNPTTAGAINNIVIGASTPLAGTFTTLTATGNTVLGDTTSDTITATARMASSLTWATDNSLDIGASGANRPRTGYYGTSVIAPLLNATTRAGVGMAAASVSTDVNHDIISAYGVRPSTSYSYPTVLVGGFAGASYVVHTSGNWGLVIARSANDTGPGNLALYHTRSTTGARTVLQDGDMLGRVNFQGVSQTGGTVTEGAAIIARSNGAISNGVLPTDLEFHTETSGNASDITYRWAVLAAGHFVPGTTNAFTVGTTSLRPSTVFTVALNVSGNTTLGDATSDTITTTARLASDLDPSGDNTITLGDPALRYAAINAVTGTFTNFSGTMTSGAVPASLVTAGTFGAGAYTFPSTLAVLADGTTMTIGGGTNVSTAIGFSGARGSVGYDGVNARLRGGLTKGVVLVVNDTTTALTIDSAAAATFASTLTVTSTLTQNGTTASLVQGATGSLFVGAAASTVSVIGLRGAAGTSRDYQFYSGTSLRWSMRASSAAESGSNAGTNWQLIARADDGTTLIDAPIDIQRPAGGTIAFSSARPITGGTYNGQTVSSAASFTGTMAIAGNTLIATGGVAATNSPRLDVIGQLAFVGADTTTDATNKLMRIGVRHYTNSEEVAAVIYANSTTSNNDVNLGGGTSTMNAATRIIFYTAANNTTTTGTVRGSITAAGLFDWDYAMTVDGVLTAGTRVTSPLIGTTTAVDVVFDRDSVTQLTLGSLAATFAGSLAITGALSGVTTLAMSGDLTYSASSFSINANTSDGSDNKLIRIAGGGAGSASRGAYLEFRGNEFASSPGQLVIATGSASGAGFFANIQGSSFLEASRAASLTTIRLIGRVEIDGVASSEFVVNETGANFDTRIEGDTFVNLFFADASTDRIGINTAAPGYLFDVNGVVNTTDAYYVDGTKVVGNQGAAVTDPAGGGVIDAEARTAIVAVIDRLQAHGLIA